MTGGRFTHACQWLHAWFLVLHWTLEDWCDRGR